MAEIDRCPKCGVQLPTDAPGGICPKCLMQKGMESTVGHDASGETVLAAGEQFGLYRIIRLLGKGGMGTVYEAEHTESGRRVALKVLNHKLQSPEHRQRFLREGRLAASVNHPNNVYVYGTEEIEGTPAISMELVAGGTELLSYRLKPNLPRIGKRHGKLIPAIREALAAAEARAVAATLAAGEGIELELDGQTIALGPEDVLVESTAAEGYACAEEGGYLVGIDTRLDEDLLREGLARELVRTVQEARKQAGLEVSDRITLRVEGSEQVEAALAEHRDYIMEETLAEVWGDADFEGDYRAEHSLGDERWTIHLAVLERP